MLRLIHRGIEFSKITKLLFSLRFKGRTYILGSEIEEGVRVYRNRGQEERHTVLTKRKESFRFDVKLDFQYLRTKLGVSRII